MPNEFEVAFDLYEMGDRPVIIDRRKDIAWVWRRRGWEKSAEIVDECYAKGRRLPQQSFVSKYPFAALRLLDVNRDMADAQTAEFGMNGHPANSARLGEHRVSPLAK